MSNWVVNGLRRLLGLPDTPDWKPPPDLERLVGSLLQVRSRVPLPGDPPLDQLAILVAVYLGNADGGKQSDAGPGRAKNTRR